MEREELEGELTDLGGRHLVLVGYSSDYFLHAEWVYNSAEIDEQEVIWARDMGEVQNRGIVRYYSDRQIWRLELEAGQAPTLLPY
jgi:hypothetical protein